GGEGEWGGKGGVRKEGPAGPSALRPPPLLHESAERRHAGPRADHDDVLVSRRQCKMLVGLEFHANVAAPFQSLCDVVRGDAFPRAALAFIAHGGNEQMCLISDLATGRSNRISPWRERTGQCTKLVGVKRDRK